MENVVLKKHLQQTGSISATAEMKVIALDDLDQQLPLKKKSSDTSETSTPSGALRNKKTTDRNEASTEKGK